MESEPAPVPNADLNFKPSDLYETPPEVFGYWNNAFQFDLDVCAEPTTAKVRDNFMAPPENALKEHWYLRGKRCWCNPPYSDPWPWVYKAHQEAKMGALTVMLLPGDSSTAWFQYLRRNQDSITIIQPPGRTRFLLNGVRQGSPKFGSTVAIFWPDPSVVNLSYATPTV